MSACLVCRKPDVETLIDLGPQPVCNRFPKDATEKEYVHPLVFGACPACGVAQLVGPTPAEELQPRCDWITYNEPEPHLDGLADRLMALPGVGTKTVVCGVSLKDDSLLQRLKARGVAETWIVDPKKDLDDEHGRAFVETIQARLTPARARTIAARRGRADLVIARHIFEHTHDPAGFFEALSLLAKPGGRVLLEAPDCARAFDDGDFSTLWEEHSLYLTVPTFRAAIEAFGASLELFESHPYAMEDSMVALARPGMTPAAAAPADRAAALARVRRFAAGLPAKRRELRAWADGVLAAGGKIAMFGAGHLGAVWINALGLADKLAFVVDDNPNKKSLRMPGSRLPILGSETLLKEKPTWALLAFNPEAEDRVIAKNVAFAAAGGRFASIFPGSPRALKSGERAKV